MSMPNSVFSKNIFFRSKGEIKTVLDQGKLGDHSFLCNPAMNNFRESSKQKENDKGKSLTSRRKNNRKSEACIFNRASLLMLNTLLDAMFNTDQNKGRRNI